jgi:hypothetical protein
MLSFYFLPVGEKVLNYLRLFNDIDRYEITDFE